jgi:hypothetical protein
MKIQIPHITTTTPCYVQPSTLVSSSLPFKINNTTTNRTLLSTVTTPSAAATAANYHQKLPPPTSANNLISTNTNTNRLTNVSKYKLNNVLVGTPPKSKRINKQARHQYSYRAVVNGGGSSGAKLKKIKYSTFETNNNNRNNNDKSPISKSRLDINVMLGRNVVNMSKSRFKFVKRKSFSQVVDVANNFNNNNNSKRRNSIRLTYTKSSVPVRVKENRFKVDKTARARTIRKSITTAVFQSAAFNQYKFVSNSNFNNNLTQTSNNSSSKYFNNRRFSASIYSLSNKTLTTFNQITIAKFVYN